MNSSIKMFFLHLLTIVLLIFGLSLSVYSKEPDWFIKLKKVKIFSSTRKDVLKVFDNPKETYSSDKNGGETDSWGESVEYETKDGKLEAFYSTGKCSNKSDGWDVEKDMVVSIEFTPKIPVSLSKFNFDLRTFSKEKEYDTSYWYYRNHRLGILMVVFDKKVTTLEFSITDEMRKLDCEKVLQLK